MNLEKLRLEESQVESINHEASYIKEDGIRRIFFNVEYDENEKKMIENLKQQLVKEDVQINFSQYTDELLLRFLYGNSFKLGQTADVISKNLQWIQSTPFQLTDNARELLEKGIVYIGGRDKQLRPILIVKGYQIQFDQFLHEDLFNALGHLLIIIEDFMFYNGKVENIVVLVETSYRQIEERTLPFKSIEMLFLLLQNNFPCILDRMYILHADKSLKELFEKMKKFLDKNLINKIQILEIFSPNENNIDVEQLELRFGGRLKDKSEYYPPRNTLQGKVQENNNDIITAYKNEFQKVLNVTRVQNHEEKKDEELSQNERELQAELDQQYKSQKDLIVNLSNVQRFPKSFYKSSCPFCKNLKFKNLHNHRHHHHHHHSSYSNKDEVEDQMKVKEVPWYINEESNERKTIMRQSVFESQKERDTEACKMF